MNWTLYGLLYLDESDLISVNISLRNFKSRINLYLKNAITLAKSLQDKGINFVLLTNNESIIKNTAIYQHYPLKIKEISFKISVPKKIRFYSAHFKIDVYHYLSSLQSSYVGLCDLDMICINDVPLCLLENIDKKQPMVYDISDQVIPAYGKEVIIRDLEFLLEVKSQGKWYGGEFISGPPTFFARLSQEINFLYEKYIQNLSKLHHIGDEMIVSSAIERVLNSGINITDAGKLQIVGRFWSIDVLHEQKKLEWYQQCFLLHLPADKIFLATLFSSNVLNNSNFIRRYQNNKKWLSRLAQKLIFF